MRYSGERSDEESTISPSPAREPSNSHLSPGGGEIQRGGLRSYLKALRRAAPPAPNTQHPAPALYARPARPPTGEVRLTGEAPDWQGPPIRPAGEAPDRRDPGEVPFALSLSKGTSLRALCGESPTSHTALLTTSHITLKLEHMNYYKDLRLDELDIASPEEAEELEYELDLRFEDFTPTDRKTWLKQNAYLEHFSQTGATTSAARGASVAVYKTLRWQSDDVLSFNRRLEVATLAFNDSLQEIALMRAGEPKAPASLIIALLRANMPEKYSEKGEDDDRAKAKAKAKELEQHRRYRVQARCEKAVGYPTFSKLAEGAENARPQYDHDPSPPNLSPAGEPSYSHLSPVGESSSSHLSPAGGEIQRGGSPHPTPYDHEPPSPNNTDDDWYPEDFSSPTAVNPPHRLTDDDLYPESSPSPQGPTDTELTRAARRELLRQQRKAEKKNTFPVKRF